MKITTKTGDSGQTDLRLGVRVPKEHPRVETNGALDELGAWIGMCRSLLEADDRWQQLLADTQQALMVVMSHVATPDGETNPRALSVAPLTEQLEAAVKELQATMSTQRLFTNERLSPLGAHLQVARTVCRRAERRLWQLQRGATLPEEIFPFINRLSDFLYVLAKNVPLP